ncbi:hypothetical protein Hamer_G007564 [Homarus americanus]|uniref:DUF5641 domain-containing protein n=2 Tax=Homarus americanus TaxID=6706 RepID=A0A8J5JU70_HOMAM|nr:hypothetical protein Hamer_G007564 [Homarus americanus]
MIGIVRNCLRKTLHKTRTTLDELRTAVTKIEIRVNNRPLTDLDDSNPIIEVLPPAHLLYGRRVDPLPSLDVQDELEDLNVVDLASEQKLRQSYKRLQKVLEGWDREKANGALPATNKVLLKLGEVVLLKKEQPRSRWPLAKIVSVHPDDKGVIRVVKVIVKSQTSLKTINKLVPLELPEIKVEERSSDEDEPVDQGDKRTSRSTGAAALSSQKLWRGLLVKSHIT